MSRLSSCACKRNFKKVTHIIWDLDGTLLDTEVIYTQIFGELAAKYGKVFTSEIHNMTSGRTQTESLKTVINALELPVTLEELTGIFVEMQNKGMETLKTMPGAEKLLRHFNAHKVPMAVATSSTRLSYDLKVRNYTEIFSFMSHVVCGDDPELKNGKPSPDIFLLAASRFPVRPENCLVFEDSPSGLRAGLAAGMQVVMVPDQIVPKDIWKSATLKLNSLEEFKPEQFGLPKL